MRLRRLFCLISSVLAVAAASEASAESTSTSPRPNIVLIYADDLGWKDTSHTGSDYYRTPHIDALAREGMTFTQAYAAAAMCAPSRAALLAGQYPARIGFFGAAGMSVPAERQRVRPIMGRWPNPKREVSIAKALRAAGYATGVIGKWQLGTRPGDRPRSRGFGFAHVIDPKAPPAKDAGPKRVDEISRVARSFIERNRERPFFLYVSELAPHTPLEAAGALVAKYQAQKPGEHHRDATLAAVIEHLDVGVGAILEAIAANGLADRTLVIFTSDNGATWRSPQAPLRGTKGSYYEGGIRVPLFVRWPGVVKPGSQSDVPVNQIDLYPTILAAAGVSPPKGWPLDGVSLLSLLDGSGVLPARALFWHAPVYTGQGGPGGRAGPLAGTPVSAIRKGDWKLLLFHDRWALDGGRAGLDDNDAVELYALDAHVDECCSVAEKNTQKRDELLDELLGWIEATGTSLATEPNPKYRPE